ncbi:hypothetical protein LJC61_05715 [Ruminococcaceae bacterium OttesenSCG-928-A16]|nr:hypothetical protein [Ruminococcaceae bacterium OttesenSCG-928-A16]
MKHILIGNGLIIQYGGSDYLNTSIIDRTMANAKAGHYEDDMKTTISPDETHQFFVLLRREIKAVLSGDYDKHAVLKEEKAALEDFHNRYPHAHMSMKNIGFEDYFLVLRLLHNKFRETSQNRYAAKTAMQRLFLDSIYNGGHINTLYQSFPCKFVDFLNGYETLFTVNYDTNIENATNRKVFHLHGQFDVLEYVYDPNSLRNQLPDRPADRFDIPTEYRHTYCNAIMDFSKDFQVAMLGHANSALEKLTSASSTNPTLLKDVESWEHDSNKMVQNLYHAYKAKTQNPELSFDEYPLSKIDSLNGEMHLLGLSPSNDTHILQRIRTNEQIETIHYYYFSENEKKIMEQFFNQKTINCSDVRKLWDSFADE